jgi:hypothetical protein
LKSRADARDRLCVLREIVLGQPRGNAEVWMIVASICRRRLGLSRRISSISAPALRIVDRDPAWGSAAGEASIFRR